MPWANFDFTVHLDKALKKDKSATAICFKRQLNATDIQVGDEGFGIRFDCDLNDGCNGPSQFGITLFASHLDSIHPMEWHAGVTNYSMNNMGSFYAGNATDFDTSYYIDYYAMIDLTFPWYYDSTQWKCYFDFFGNSKNSDLSS